MNRLGFKEGVAKLSSKIRNILLCIAQIFSSLSSVNGQSRLKNGEDRSFIQLLEKVSQSNPEIRANNLDLEASNMDIKSVDALNYPQINFNAAETYTQIIARNGGYFPQESAFVELRQNLWNQALKTQVHIKNLEYKERKANNTYAEAVILRRFAMLYIDWINALQSLEVFSNQEKYLSKILSLNEKRFRMHDDTKLTYKQTKVRLLNAKAQVRLLKERSASLQKRVAMEAGLVKVLRPYPQEFEKVFKYLLKQVHSETDDLLGKESRQARLDVADGNIEVAENANGARLDFVARAGVTNYNGQNSYNYNGKSLIPEVDLGLELVIPLYDGSAKKHNLRASMLRRNALEERNNAELALLKNQMVEWKSNRNLNEGNTKNYEDLKSLIKSRYQGLETLYRSGSNTLFELLNTSEDFLLIERQHVADYEQKLQADVELSVAHNLLTAEGIEKLKKHFGGSHE